MNAQASQTRDELAAKYLLQLQALAAEISVATDAIGANELASLQESVGQQEILCARLASMAGEVGEALRLPERPLRPSTETSVATRIRATTLAIRELNLQYEALLKHSGRSIALLASLCRSHTGVFQEARGPRGKHQTWSCEM